jgi:hypothetical protein
VPKLVLDANMLLVFVIGTVNPRLLGVAKRMKAYRPTDYDLLHAYLSLFSAIILLPNTVTEASNLLDHVKGERRDECMAVLMALTGAHSERYIPSISAAEQPEYMALGITDAAILCALQSDTLLLTADRALYLAATYRGREAQHFDDLRGA